MREARAVPYGRRKRRRRGGCFGWIFLLALAVLAVWGGFRLAGGLREQILQARYPIKYQALVEEYAAEFQLEPALVYAVIRTESRFDPYAVSGAGAKGLMQLLDETALDCAKGLGLKDFSLDQSFEPALNIRMGCYYLSKLLKKYGSIETAAAAYNGGPGNVERWLADQALLDEKGRLVRVPYAETRSYVERVVRAYGMYRELYAI